MQLKRRMSLAAATDSSAAANTTISSLAADFGAMTVKYRVGRRMNRNQDALPNHTAKREQITNSEMRITNASSRHTTIQPELEGKFRFPMGHHLGLERALQKVMPLTL